MCMLLFRACHLPVHVYFTSIQGLFALNIKLGVIISVIFLDPLLGQVFAGYTKISCLWVNITQTCSLVS